MTTQDVATTEAKVTRLPNGWSSVECGVGRAAFSVSASPDKLLHLPRHCTQEQVKDVVAAMLAAVEVATAPDDTPPARTAATDVPAFGLRRAQPKAPPVKAGPKPLTSSIGRRGRKAQPPRGAQPAVPAPRVPAQRQRGR
jgi:hypothetical protein